MHRECAAIAIKLCPALKRDVEEQGTLAVRQVFAWRAQVAIMAPDYVKSITGTAVQAGPWEDRTAQMA
jgi:hypothetical protein